jgi:predicted metal-dependent hydrolase
VNSGFDNHLAKGLALFNQGEHYAAHEAWEIGWLAEPSDERLLLQGLIQVAAGFVKLSRGEPHATAKLLGLAQDKLRRFVGQAHGLDLPAFLLQVEAWRERASAMAHEGRVDFDPAALPRLNRLP